MDPQLHFVECLGKIEVRRRVVPRIAAEDDQQLDRAATHFLHQFAERNPVSG